MLLHLFTPRKIIFYALLLVVLIPSLFFINLMPTPTFDEGYHLVDIYRYINKGINISTIYLHTTPTGPGTHLWVAIWGKFLGSSLPLFRLSIWLCWVSICLLFFRLYQQDSKNKILFSFIFSLSLIVSL